MESVRCFVAVELPDEVRRDIDRQTVPIRETTGRLVKWVPAQNLHITLKFLGAVPVEKLPELYGLLEEAVSGFAPFGMEAYGTGMFPSAKSPRVLWVGLTGPGFEILRAVRDGVEEACEKAGFGRESAAFKPHATVGRIRPEGMKDRRAIAALVEGLATLQAHSFGMIRIEKITLMKSVLKPGGPEYSALREILLPDG